MNQNSSNEPDDLGQYERYERPTFIVIDNGERINVSDVEFMDIAEDIYGRDIMTFKYKGKVYSSNVYR